MTDGLMLAPGEGHRIRGGALDATVKVSGGFGASTFELVIPPGYDVGAHVHASGEELFYVLDGMVDLLAYEPTVRTSRDWHDWMSRGGRRFLRGGPGSLLFVPAGSPRPERNRCPARQVRHRAAHAVARSEPTLTRPCS